MSIAAYDTATGDRLWTVPSRLPERDRGLMTFNAAGNLLQFQASADGVAVVELPTWTLRNSGFFHEAAPVGSKWIQQSGAASLHRLMEVGRDEPLFTVDTRTAPLGLGQLSPDGRFIFGLTPSNDAIVVFDLN